MSAKEETAAEKLTDLVADFLYGWVDVGGNPETAARRLLGLAVSSVFFDQAVREIREGLDKGENLGALGLHLRSGDS